MMVFTEHQIISSATVSEIDMEAFDSFMRAQGKQTEDGPQRETDDDLRNASVCGTEPELLNEVDGGYVRVRFRTRAGTEPGGGPGPETVSTR